MLRKELDRLLEVADHLADAYCDGDPFRELAIADAVLIRAAVESLTWTTDEPTIKGNYNAIDFGGEQYCLSYPGEGGYVFYIDPVLGEKHRSTICTFKLFLGPLPEVPQSTETENCDAKID